jgi:hypothetical protein
VVKAIRPLVAFFVLPLIVPCAMSGAEIDFARDVHPILTKRCTSCHSGTEGQAGLALNTRAEMLKGGVSGPAIVPGKSAESLLISRVDGTKLPLMPLSGPPLPASELSVLRGWIDSGAKMSELPPVSIWKAPLEPREPQLPAAAKAAAIDYIVDAYFKKHNVTAPPPVSDEIFVRRAYLDLSGLLPTPEQRKAFLTAKSASKRADLVSGLISDRKAFAEHWISFWNDLLHNDEGVSYIGDRKSISKWLLKALETNMPYDQMAATLLNPPTDDSLGFIMGVNWRGDINASQTPVMQAAQNSAQVFLGVNLKCNSCHDSFISSWKLKDAYGLASFFADAPLEIARCDAKTGEFSSPSFLYPELGKVDPEATLKQRRQTVAELFTKKENGRFARTFVNRVWQRLFGRGIVASVDDMDAEPFDADLLDWLAFDFAAHGYDVDYLLKQIMSSKAYQLPAMPLAEKEPAAFVFKGPLYRRLTAEQFADALSSISSEWRILGSTKPGAGTYERDWRFKSNSLARALGRPTRDLAVTERFNDPTMLQMLELVNGETLAGMVQRGALRLLGQLPPAPAAIYDSGVVTSKQVEVDADISNVAELHLLTIDQDSYDAARVKAGWMEAKLESASGTVDLSTLKPRQAAKTGTVQVKGSTARPAILADLPSELTYDLKGKGFTRLKATVGVDEATTISEINPRVRFFLFKQAPDKKQLTAATGTTPVPYEVGLAPEKLVERLFVQAMGRAPSREERTIAMDLLAGEGGTKKASPQGLEDLIWSLLLSPEFQYIM